MTFSICRPLIVIKKTIFYRNKREIEQRRHAVGFTGEDRNNNSEITIWRNRTILLKKEGKHTLYEECRSEKMLSNFQALPEARFKRFTQKEKRREMEMIKQLMLSAT